MIRLSVEEQGPLRFEIKRKVVGENNEIKEEHVMTFLARRGTTDEWLRESSLAAMMSVSSDERERAQAFAARIENRLGIITGWEGVEEEYEVDGAVTPPTRPCVWTKEKMVRLLRANDWIFNDLQHQIYLHFRPDERTKK